MSNHTTYTNPYIYTRPARETDSVTVYKKYGVHRSQAIYINNNLWRLSNDLSDLFEQYYILSWTGYYFNDKMCNGTIERDGITYQIIYYNTTPLEAKRAKNVYLSLRHLQPEFKHIPTVLVGLTKNGKRDYEI